MNKEEHIAIHKELHDSFDRLLADFIGHTKKLPNKTTILELAEWSASQIVNPTKENFVDPTDEED